MKMIYSNVKPEAFWFTYNHLSLPIRPDVEFIMAGSRHYAHQYITSYEKHEWEILVNPATIHLFAFHYQKGSAVTLRLAIAVSQHTAATQLN